MIFVNKDRVIEFYKAGQLTSQEQQQVLDLSKNTRSNRIQLYSKLIRNGNCNMILDLKLSGSFLLE